MAEPKTVGLEEAQRLLQEGYLYVDVRTEEEFEAGHAPFSFNVPFQTSVAGAHRENQAFVRIMCSVFKLDQPLLLACKSGMRSQAAARVLCQAGFNQLADLSVGFEGTRDHFGRKAPGWHGAGLPTETGSGTAQSYAEICRRAGPD
jgi:rhodanese-related sulfurtransferase